VSLKYGEVRFSQKVYQDVFAAEGTSSKGSRSIRVSTDKKHRCPYRTEVAQLSQRHNCGL
jgi:hypothetical protein